MPNLDEVLKNPLPDPLPVYEPPDRYAIHSRAGKEREVWYPRYLRRVYGITVEEAQARLEAQEFKCAICLVHLDTELSRHTQIDHDHKTGRVRGIVCVRCNLAIGWIEDDPTRAQRIVEYLSVPPTE